MMRPILAQAFLASALLTAVGCYSDEPSPQYAGQPEEDDNGDLVEVSPGVEVVADYDEPVFFADNAYWSYRGGIWYTSGWYRGGWVRAGRVPDRVVHIDHPEGFRHYRPAGYVTHARVTGGYRSHAQFHDARPVGGVRVRAAVRINNGRHR
ncbi:MAG TPA: hypothetical protein VFP84_02320 [Kofleriaceae bacterium]|nr:hypothetical protein [Kofleriaceae bacterium]